MLSRAVQWWKLLWALGSLWLMSRRAHIEEDLPAEFGDGTWIAFATHEPVQPGEPTYGTPAFRAVTAGERYWIFVEEGTYWVYALPGADPQVALREFYANPDGARLIDSGVSSVPGFRARVTQVRQLH